MKRKRNGKRRKTHLFRQVMHMSRGHQHVLLFHEAQRGGAGRGGAGGRAGQVFRVGADALEQFLLDQGRLEEGVQVLLMLLQLVWVAMLHVLLL